MGVLEGKVPERPATGTVSGYRGHPFGGYSAGGCLWLAVQVGTHWGFHQTTNRPLFRGTSAFALAPS
jgi:hypothetical protein